MSSIRSLAVLAAAILILPRGAAAQRSDADWLEGCDRHGDRGRATFCEIRNVAVATTGSLDIESENSVVRIGGDEQPGVRLRARVRAWSDSPEEARAIAGRVRVSADGGRVRASGPDTDRGEGWQVDFVGMVPRAYSLDIDAANGPISVRGMTGSVRIEGSNGPVELRGLSGAVHARTSNGPLTLEMTGDPLAAGGIDVETSNGPLTVTLPRGIDARLEASTDNGPISTNMDVPIRRENRWSMGGEIDATLGSGGSLIRARTSNGPLTIRED